MRLFGIAGAALIAVSCSFGHATTTPEYTLSRPVASVQAAGGELHLPLSSGAGPCFGVGYITPDDLVKIERQEGFKLAPGGQITLASDARAMFGGNIELISDMAQGQQICKDNGLRLVVRTVDSPTREGYQRVSLR